MFRRSNTHFGYIFYLIIAIIAFVSIMIFRTLWVAGTFKSLPKPTEVHTEIIKGIVGAEDITIDQTTGIALVSSCDRRKILQDSVGKGGIYSVDFQASPPKVKNLTFDFNQDDFRPHGISLFIDPIDSSKWLFVVNHRQSGHYIEIFQYTDSTLLHAETIKSTLIMSPNDVVGVEKRAFYFTNDHKKPDKFSTVKDYMLIGTGSVGYFDGKKVQLLDDGIRYANGITVSPDGKKIFVAACTDGSINIYDREPFLKISKIECNTGVDNLEWDAEGNLWVGAHPQLLKFAQHAKNSASLSPSQVLKIHVSDTSNPVVEEIYINHGTPMSGSSVAAKYKDYILVGSVFDDGVMVIK